MSTFADGYVVIHIASGAEYKQNGADLIMHCMRKAELATVLTEELLLPVNGSRALSLEFADVVRFRYKMAGSKYRSAKGTETRTLCFVEDGALLPKGGVAELDEKTASSSKITVRVSPELGSKAPMQLHAETDAPPPRKSLVKRLSESVAAAFGGAPPPPQKGYQQAINNRSSNARPPPRLSGVSSGNKRPSGTPAKLANVTVALPPPVPKRGAAGRRSFSTFPQARVLYDYAASSPQELSLKIGELIRVVEKFEDGWWNGERMGRLGLFPSNYVELV